MDWREGSKFGASGSGTLTEGTPMDLVGNGADIRFTGSGRYKVEISNLSIETLYFMGAFGDWMPDLNYGDVSKVESNPCFQNLAASADKWIGLGIDGFRLDAVKHICGGINSYNNASNHTFLQKWYDHCNTTFKASGHADNIFMVGEVWSAHNDTNNPQNSEKNYYKGLTSCFEFGYWPVLYRALVNQNASSYVSTVSGFLADHKSIRSDAETSLFMTNHDHSSVTGDGEVRAADDLGKNLAKEKQAAAMILTTPGKPFVYQGEELGYWGNSKNRGDEYLRAPILWDKAGKDCAKQGVNGKVDSGMLTSTISVEAQTADANSLLNVYKTWSRLRNIYPALAEGTMAVAPGNGGTIAAWYMTAGSQKLLVIHNTATSEKNVTVQDNTSRPVALLGTATLDHDVLTLGANSSVVFKL
jgi:glycosidase